MKYTDCKACNGTDEILDRTTGDYITCPACKGSGFQEIPSDDITVFTDAYIEAALFTDFDEPLTSDNLSKEVADAFEKDCKAFVLANYEMIKDDLSQAGHDFWMTRQGHGCGFWETDQWPRHHAELTKAADKYSHIDLYLDESDNIVRFL